MTSKKDADYRIADAADPNGGSCGECKNFIPPQTCTLVQGTVSAGGVCDLFQPLQAQQSETGTDSLMAQLFGNTQGKGD
jgi:hypothetical protein